MNSVSLHPVLQADNPLLWQHLQQYLAEMPSENKHHFKDENGLWKYPWFDSYWEQPTRHPFLIYRGETLVGFCMIRELIPTELYSIAEFYIFQEYRRQGIGLATMKRIEKRFPNKHWQLGYLKASTDTAVGALGFDDCLCGGA